MLISHVFVCLHIMLMVFHCKLEWGNYPPQGVLGSGEHGIKKYREHGAKKTRKQRKVGSKRFWALYCITVSHYPYIFPSTSVALRLFGLEAPCILHTFRLVNQGSQRPGKSWKTWKMKSAFSRPGKIMDFEKKAKIMEKSWNFKISIWKNHGKKFWRFMHSIQY